jgi:SagB-type dehydrogenase family enzyme
VSPDPQDWLRICEEYRAVTSYDRATLDTIWEDRSYDRDTRPETYLTYPEALKRIELGEPVFPSRGPDLWQVLAARRSKRDYLDEAITLQELNLLLWASQGISGELKDYQLRTAPSSGALYPIETFLFVQRVEGLDPGLYHLDVRGWALEALKLEEDVADTACAIALDQEHARLAAVNVLWSAVMERCRRKYYERAYRYVWWDAGHVAENLHLAATSLGLGSVSMGAWYDEQAHDYLGIDGVEHFTALMASVGRVKGADWEADRRV